MKNPMRRLAEILMRLEAIDEGLRRREQAMNYSVSVNGLVDLGPFPSPTAGTDWLQRLGYARQWGEMFRPAKEADSDAG